MIAIAILGFGTVGTGVAEILQNNRDLLTARLGDEITVKYILDRRSFPGHPLEDRVVSDMDKILGDPEVKLVAECMGGSHPAADFTEAALKAGKSVVTSNKEVVANFGSSLLETAREHGVGYCFEASVGGGIPIIRPMQKDLAPNHVTAITGILNGTTNYMLTKMSETGAPFADILAQAQTLGYAEANPAADVDGLDAARKIVILAALAWGKMFAADAVSAKGIREVTPDMLTDVAKMGGRVKLIARAELDGNGKPSLSVAPWAVLPSCPLSGVNDVFNGILVGTDMLGDVMFYGRGAGKLPTASAMVADIFDLLSQKEAPKLPAFAQGLPEELANPAALSVSRMIFFRGYADDAGEVRQSFGRQPVFEDHAHRLLGVITSPMTEEEFAHRCHTCPLPRLFALPVLR